MFLLSSIHCVLAVLAASSSLMVAPTPSDRVAFPDELVVVSSTVLTAEGEQPFVLTASNLGADPVVFVHPAPRDGDVVTEAGTFDGVVWTVEVGPGVTVKMTGR